MVSLVWPAYIPTMFLFYYLFFETGSPMFSIDSSEEKVDTVHYRPSTLRDTSFICSLSFIIQLVKRKSKHPDFRSKLKWILLKNFLNMRSFLSLGLQIFYNKPSNIGIRGMQIQTGFAFYLNASFRTISHIHFSEYFLCGDTKLFPCVVVSEDGTLKMSKFKNRYFQVRQNHSSSVITSTI